MYFKNYHYFLAIVENGGLTKGAQALYLSQPSLSKYLRKLEQQLGTQLFDHASSPLKLTYAGERYLEYIRRLQSMERQFTAELTDIRSDEAGVIRIGIAPWRGSILLPALLPAFQKLYPHIQVEISEGRAQQIEGALIQGKLDLCLMNLPSHHTGQTAQKVLWNERLLLVGNRAHPAVQKAMTQPPAQGAGYRSIDLRFLENEHFITMKPGQNVAVATEKLFDALSLTPKSTWATENMTTAISMVSAGMGFTMMPEAGVRISSLPDNLVFFTVEHEQQYFPFAAVYRKDQPLSKPALKLLDLAAQIYG